MTPADMQAGKRDEIGNDREKKFEMTRLKRI